MPLISATVQIVGTRPLLFHRFTPDALPLVKLERTGVAGNDPEEWKRTYTATKDGQLYLHSTYVFGCLREGAKYLKKGRGTFQSIMAATLFVADSRVLLDRYVPSDLSELDNDLDKPVYVDISAVRNPATRGRNVRYRLALSPGWRTTFTIQWDSSLINREQMAAICNDAGVLVGLADGRAIGNGRFEVESFEVMDSAKKPPA